MQGAAIGAGRSEQRVFSERLAPWLPVLVIAYPMTVWPLLVGSQTSVFVDLLPAQGDASSTALNRIYFLPLFAAALWVCLMQPSYRRISIPAPANVLLFTFLVWAGLTALWSYDPGITLRRLLLEVAILGIPFLAATGLRDPREFLDRLYWLHVANLIVNLPVIALETPGPLGYEGIYPQKNYLGAIMAMTVLISLYQVIGGRRLMRWVGLATLVIAIGLIMLSRSKTSLGLAVIVPVFATILALGMRNLRISPAISMLGIVLLLFGIYKVGAESGTWEFGDLAETLLGDRTLTERTAIWDFAFTMIERKPWFGWGYQAFWEMGPGSPVFREGPGFVAKMPHAHNGYIDTALQTGYAGLAILVLFLLAAYDQTRIAIDRFLPAGIFMLSIIVMTTLHNGLESSFFRGFDDVFVMLIVVLSATAPWVRRQA